MNIDKDMDEALVAYLKPVADDGFSDQVLAQITAQTTPIVPIEEEASRWSRWAGPLISLCLGGSAALIWNALVGPITLGGSVDLSAASDIFQGTGLYISFGLIALLAWLISEALSTA